MSDPERLLDLDSLDATSEFERDLVAALRPADDARSRVWRGLAGSVGVAIGTATLGAAASTSAVASQGAAPASASLFGSAASKLLLLGAFVVPAIGAFTYFSAQNADEPAAVVSRSPAPSRAAAPPNIAASPNEHDGAVADRTPAVVPVEATDTRSSPVSRAADSSSRLAEENRLLREARDALRAGDAARALSSLTTMDRKFPSGALLQERELLRVQALLAAGSRERAVVVAKRFVSRYPSSPYATKMRTLVGETSVP